jgi:3-oxoacyl-[acyl-carrier-protein] synthase II
MEEHMRRVVVTGLGMVSPVGANVEDSWSNILAGKSGAGQVTRYDMSDMACGDGTNGTFNIDDWMEPKEQRKVDPFIIYRHGGRDSGAGDAGWHPEDRREPQIAPA